MSATFSIPTQNVIAGQLITAALWNGEFQNLYDNFTPAGVDDYAATDGQFQTQTDPYPSSVISKPTSLAGELERIRYEIAQLKGKTYHYEPSDLTLAQAYELYKPGIIVPYGGTSAPSGWLLCDGSAVSRTTYASLFAVVGTAFGSGNGSTTFNIPDFRGRFLRGKDGGASRDPDKASRTAMASGGNTGDNVGSVQGDATKRPTTPFVTGGVSADHTHVQTGHPGGSFNTPGTGSFPAMANNAQQSNTSGASADHTHTVASGGDSETRPINANVNYLIKA